MSIKYLIFFVLCIFFASNVLSQSFGIDFELETRGQRSLQYSFDIPPSPNIDFYAISVRLERSDIQNSDIRLSLSSLDVEYTLDAFADKEDNNNTFVTNILYVDGKKIGPYTLNIEDFKSSNSEKINGYVRVFAAEKGIENRPLSSELYEKALGCVCPQPLHIPRSIWGEKFNLNTDIHVPPATYTAVTHLIVHHSAGTNQSNNWSSVVASIFDFHVNTNGWQDVGYNWLIDPNGVIYQGRGGGDNVRGAHMCGFNNNTMGVCMLGNFEIIQPSDPSIEALEKLLAWKSCRENIDPTGSGDIVSHFGNMLNISGHQDGCRPGHTACPGQFFIPKLALLRERTKAYSDENCREISNIDNLMPPQFYIFPNPASDYFCYSENVDGNITLTDIFGRSTSHSSHNNCVDITALPQGVYYAYSKSQSIPQKVVIVR